MLLAAEEVESPLQEDRLLLRAQPHDGNPRSAARGAATRKGIMGAAMGA
jgi:hypothetical protein